MTTPVTVLVVTNGKVKCPQKKKEVTVRSCFECKKLRMVQPRDGGELWCSS